MSEAMLEAVRGLYGGLKRIADPLANWRGCCAKRWTTRPRRWRPYTKAGWTRAGARLDRRAKTILPPGFRCSTLWSMARYRKNSSTGSRSCARTAANADVGLKRHWVDPTKPFSTMVWSRRMAR